MRTWVWLALASLLSCALPALAFDVPEQKISASDGATIDFFGRSVSISGDVAIVGASQDDDNGSKSGSAYVYRLIGGTWTLEKKLTASDGAAEDFFGVSVSISGDVAIVGAYWDDDNGNSSGSAYIYQRNWGGADNWGELTKLTASDGTAYDYFGESVSISGDVAIVGAYLDNDRGFHSGSAYYYDFSCGNAVIDGLETCDDGNNTGGDGCSSTCAVEDGYICDASEPTVCSPLCGNGVIDGIDACDDGNRTGGDGCSPTCAVESGYSCDASAHSICVDVDECELGTDDCLAGDNCTNTLGSFLCGCRSPEQKITAFDGVGGGYFGHSVSISGDTAIVGDRVDGDNDYGLSSGSAYIYDRNQGGPDIWGDVTKLTASDRAVGDRFGLSVSISGDVAIVGAYGDDNNGTSSGSAFVYRRNQGGANNWGEDTKLTASDGAARNRFGSSVSISGDVAIVGAYGDDDNGSYSGSAYYYDLSCGNGLIDGIEACDDGNNADGDGCSCTCTVEDGYICDVSEPMVCTLMCGNGLSCGDYDEDGDVDLDDCAVLVECLLGPDVLVPAFAFPRTAVGCLDAFDSDFDGDIDQVDVANFTIVFSP